MEDKPLNEITTSQRRTLYKRQQRRAIIVSTAVWVTGGIIGGYLWQRARRNEVAPLEALGKEQLRERVGVAVQLAARTENPATDDSARQAMPFDKQFDLLEKASVRWTRIGIGWNRIEADRDKFDWDEADQAIQAARNHHLSVLWKIRDLPAWASDTGRSSGTPNDLNKPNSRYVQFVRKLVERYKDDVHYWEIGREPDSDEIRDDSGSLKYPRMLERAHEAIVSADSTAKVVLGSARGRLPRQLKWLRDLVGEYRIKRQELPFDIANFQLPGSGLNVSASEGQTALEHYVDVSRQQINSTMNGLGLTDMPVWISSFNYPAARESQLDPQYEGEGGQARAVSTLLASLVRGRENDKVFWTYLFDDYETDTPSTGLIYTTERGSIVGSRPAYDALKALLGD